MLTQKKRKKNVLINIILFILLLIGLALIFNGPIKNFLVGQMTAENSLKHASVEKIKENQNQQTTFDFDAVEALDFQSVVKSKFNKADLYTLGGIAIPAVQLNLPIFKGVSNYSLIVGAGTMKPDQKMGTGNYALASHHMLEENMLFGPLVRSEVGQSIYLTDLETIYEYKITWKEYVDPTRVGVIEDVSDKKLITLVTCDATGANRLIVQGELTKTTPNKQATEEMTQAFNLDLNTY